MNALSPLGMVSELPSSNQSSSDIARAHVEEQFDEQKDYFVEKDGVKFAGTHLLIDLWGASNLGDPAHIDRALREAADAAGATILSFPPFLPQWRRERRVGVGREPHLHPHVAGAGFRCDRRVHVRRMQSLQGYPGAEGSLQAVVDQSGRTASRLDRLIFYPR